MKLAPKCTDPAPKSTEKWVYGRAIKNKSITTTHNYFVNYGKKTLKVNILAKKNKNITFQIAVRMLMYDFIKY